MGICLVTGDRPWSCWQPYGGAVGRALWPGARMSDEAAVVATRGTGPMTNTVPAHSPRPAPSVSLSDSLRATFSDRADPSDRLAVPPAR